MEIQQNEEVSLNTPVKELTEEQRQQLEATGVVAAPPKKKKKKKRKKKKKHKVDPEYLETYPLTYDINAVINGRGQKNDHIVNLGQWREIAWKQTQPPIVPIHFQYEDGQFPVGELQPYMGDQAYRNDNEEMQQKDLLLSDKLHKLRKAAEVHRQVRKYAQSIVKPGIKLLDFCQSIESTLRYLIKANRLDAGQAFPTGVSINNCAAHFSPNYGDTKVLQYGDVMKLDFGTHINGYLIDSAFTIAFDPQYENLLKAAQDATETGIRTAGIDVRLCDVGEAIQEAMESYEVEINGKTHQVRCVKNLCGHSIE